MSPMAMSAESEAARVAALSLGWLPAKRLLAAALRDEETAQTVENIKFPFDSLAEFDEKLSGFIVRKGHRGFRIYADLVDPAHGASDVLALRAQVPPADWDGVSKIISSIILAVQEMFKILTTGNWMPEDIAASIRNSLGGRGLRADQPSLTLRLEGVDKVVGIRVDESVIEE